MSPWVSDLSPDAGQLESNRLTPSKTRRNANRKFCACLDRLQMLQASLSEDTKTRGCEVDLTSRGNPSQSFGNKAIVEH
jgi:hypothetical protein